MTAGIVYLLHFTRAYYPARPVDGPRFILLPDLSYPAAA